MTRFSANLGFLWTDRSLPQAIEAAAAAGFDAVECHWPYDTPTEDVAAALQDTGLNMLGINTSRGNVEAGDAGLSALPNRHAEARAAIDQAIAYAAEISALNVHVMAGIASGAEAHAAFVSNLRYASTAASKHDIGILIEPINPYDMPGYFLNSTGQASDIIAEVGADNVKLMFDCYHVQQIEGDICNRLERLKPIIGHIQFASVPDRGAPDHGEINYAHIFGEISRLGYEFPLGAEYKPQSTTEDTLGWLNDLRSR